uniref:Sorting nexin-29 n=1 Tax=Clastoptera arizonana TaxID=38151 RepID=A0A1B6CB94_9HEMI
MVPGALSLSNSRQKLLDELLSSVKQCQIRFGGKTELATEYDQYVTLLCKCLESILSHGLKPKPVIKTHNSAIKLVTEHVLRVTASEQLVFWNYVKEHLTKHERDRYEHLKHVSTDIGRGRAWLRSALNERSLERYMLCLLDPNSLKISSFYEDWAFLLDQERSNVLPQAAAGLASILFAISIDRPELNEGIGGTTFLEQEPVIVVPEKITGLKKKGDNKKRKHISANIISFDKDFEEASPPQADTTVFSLEPEILVGEEIATYLDGCISDQDITAESDIQEDGNNVKGLRPLNNENIGLLIPVSLNEETQVSEDSLSVPSFSEEGEYGNVGGSSTEVVEPCCEAIASEDATSQLMMLKNELDQTKEHYQQLKSQINQTTTNLQEKVISAESKIQALNRENDLLKHQLRKYVTAVQMLKQGDQMEEAELYEKKLVQVAEMHGELMELNDRLQRQLLVKERTITTLKIELESLRGPLLDSDQEDPIGTALISLWIPCVFLAGSNSPHHVYQVHIRILEDEWNVYRRYAQFYNLHKQLKKQYQEIATYNFPPKKTIGNKDEKFVEERRQKLQQYLRKVVNHIIKSHDALSAAPSKPLLLSLLPFLGDQIHCTERKRPCPSDLLPKHTLTESPQYTGL